MTAPFAPGLYVVATPIGNLEDFSPRAQRVLREAVLVAAEDTRTSKILLVRAESNARMVSLTEHNVEARIPSLIEAAESGVVALVSDAGTPVIADPGARLVAAAHLAGVTVVPIPGPSALTAAVSAAGFNGSDVLFIGFLPKAKGERLNRLVSAAATSSVFVFFESPTRLGKTLLELSQTVGDPRVTICRELTKLHEEVVSGAASKLAGRFATTRGECTVVVESPVQEKTGTASLSAETLAAAMKRAGARQTTAASEIARLTGTPRDTIYALWESL